MSEIVMDTEQIKAAWLELSAWYLETVETTTAIYATMIPMLKLKTATRIAEAGCGNGNGIDLLILSLNRYVEIYANDLTDAMLDIARAKNHPFTQYITCSNEELPYENESIDRYIANLSLHIVSEPAKMIAEAYRVLQTDGIAAFSVWGREVKSTMHSYMNEAIYEVFGKPDIVKRSHFHLNNPERLKSMLKAGGFNRVLTYFTLTPVGLSSLDEAIQFYSEMPTIKKMKSHERFEEFLSVLGSKLQRVFDIEETINFECLVAIAYK